MFRPRWYAKLPSWLKHPRDSSRAEATRYGSSLRTIEVHGGLTWTQWSATLTDECPTFAPGNPRVTRAYKHCERARSRGGTRDGPTVARSGMAAAP